MFVVLLGRYFSLFEGTRAQASVQKREMVVSTIGNPRPPFGDMRRRKMVEQQYDESFSGEWGYLKGDVPSDFFMSPDQTTASMCASQGLHVVPCECAGLTGFDKDDDSVRSLTEDLEG
mgnify:FL=1